MSLYKPSTERVIRITYIWWKVEEGLAIDAFPLDVTPLKLAPLPAQPAKSRGILDAYVPTLVERAVWWRRPALLDFVNLFAPERLRSGCQDVDEDAFRKLSHGGWLDGISFIVERLGLSPCLLIDGQNDESPGCPVARTPFEAACVAGHLDVVAYLDAWCQKHCRSPSCQAAFDGRLVQLIISRRTGPHNEDDIFRTLSYFGSRLRTTSGTALDYFSTAGSWSTVSVIEYLVNLGLTMQRIEALQCLIGLCERRQRANLPPAPHEDILICIWQIGANPADHEARAKPPHHTEEEAEMADLERRIRKNVIIRGYYEFLRSFPVEPDLGWYTSNTSDLGKTLRPRWLPQRERRVSYLQYLRDDLHIDLKPYLRELADESVLTNEDSEHQVPDLLQFLHKEFNYDLASDNNRLFYRSAEAGALSSLAYLRDNGVDIRMDNDIAAVLMVAEQWSEVDIFPPVRWLHSIVGADLRARGDAVLIALCRACRLLTFGLEELIEFFVETYGLDILRTQNDLPMRIAVNSDHKKLLSILSNYGVPLTEVESVGRTLQFTVRNTGEVRTGLSQDRYGPSLNQACWHLPPVFPDVTSV
ncbi:hypothetical protein HKX48_004362 [Thoreauomyces humboldtii]|nr:hypothetical protein HKX48_004361 [Thoreauomyces humboldtii]KAJ3023068.1 hypothetical protein HKX48_004362 [Thoreauomyces humboldtii]